MYTQMKTAIEACEKVRDSAVTQTGVTITADGRWALLAQVRRGTQTPLKKVEQIAGEFPVVYEEEPGTLQIARPAFPRRGE